MEKAKPKAGKAKKSDTHVDNPKAGFSDKEVFPVGVVKYTKYILSFLT